MEVFLILRIVFHVYLIPVYIELHFNFAAFPDSQSSSMMSRIWPPFYEKVVWCNRESTSVRLAQGILLVALHTFSKRIWSLNSNYVFCLEIWSVSSKNSVFVLLEDFHELFFLAQAMFWLFDFFCEKIDHRLVSTVI